MRANILCIVTYGTIGWRLTCMKFIKLTYKIATLHYVFVYIVYSVVEEQCRCCVLSLRGPSLS